MPKDLIWIIGGILLGSALILSGCSSKEKTQTSYEISADDVYERLQKGEELYLVDVRTPEEYAEKHIPGALLIPLDDLEKRYEEIPKDREVIIVCRSARRSGIATDFLVGKGYKDVKNMLGGMLRWNELELK